MKIRPKYNILKAATGVKFSSANANGANWRQQVFENYRLHLLDLLAAYGEGDDYGHWLNEMLSRHAKIWKLAGNNWENVAYENPDVGKYLQDYRGGLGNNGQYQRFGTVLIKDSDRYDFNQTGIKTNQATRYNIINPPSRISGDYSRTGHNYTVDNLYSAITDDRRLLGRKGDWDENSDTFKLWLKDLNHLGWETYLDKDNYYKLRRISKESETPVPTEVSEESLNYLNQVGIGTGKSKGLFNWTKVGEGFKNILGNPDLYALGRLTGNLINNSKVYDEALKGIKPTLKDTYLTHRLVVGDEATKQAYYRRAAEGQTKAAKPFTSDADRLMAYLMEAKRQADELRALGDLADNQEIRRTSDESNQHQWANTQRATEVANYNTASINLANALKYNLLALKHSALWSSIDNFLKGIEYRKRQQLAEDLQIDDKIWELLMLDLMSTHPDFIKAKNDYNIAYRKAYSEGATEEDEENLTKAEEALTLVRKKLLVNYYLNYRNRASKRHLINWSKYGSKITWKRKEDLLYKSARDVVDHFRKISKIASDSYNRKQPKIEKLTSHPKYTIKYQLGGTAPFTVYTPVSIGGETSTSYSYGSSSGSGSSKKSEGNDLLKDLLKTLSFEGLPSDVNSVYTSLNGLLHKSQLFGTELSFEDVANMYVRQMQKISLIKYNKSQFDKAQTNVNSKNANSDLALDTYGRLVVLNKEGKIEYISVDDYKDNYEEYIPLTNDLVLNFRALGKAFDSNLILVASNATSMEEIGKFLKALLPKIGDSEQTLEGYTKQDSNLIRKGIAVLKDAPIGDYKFSEYSKNLTLELKKLAYMAILYLSSILPLNMLNLIKVNSELGRGLSQSDLIYSLVHSELDENYLYKINTSSGSTSNSKSGSGGSAENSAGLAFVLGQGPREMVNFNTGTSNAISVLGIKGVLQTKSKENLGQGATLQDATKSLLGGYLEWNKATFGGSKLNSLAYSHIILNDSTIIGMDLPYTKDINGNDIPDFLILRKIEEADLYISLNNITDFSEINKVYLLYGLAPKYTPNGELNTLAYKRFAAILATLDEDSLQDKSAILSDEIALAGDIERDLYEEAVKKSTSNKNYNLSDGMWGTGWFSDKLYKGTIFIPYSEDIAFAALSSGEPFKLGLPDNVATIQQMLYAPKVSSYKAPDTTVSQLKNN